LVALSPYVAEKYECLYLTYLPFEEDIRDWPFPSLAAPSDTHLAAADQLIDAMILPTEDRTYKVSRMPNPIIQRFSDLLKARVCDPSAPVPDLDVRLAGLLKSAMEEATPAVAAQEGLKREFKLTAAEVTTVKRRKFWKDALQAKRQAVGEVDTSAITVGSASRPAQGEPPAPAPMAAPVRIGTVNPIRDFRQAISDRRGAPDGVDRTTEAIDQLTKVIERFLSETLSDCSKKACECLRALRQGCVEENAAIKYNAALRGLKASCEGLTGPRGAFWSSVVESGLSLISDDEATTSDVSREEAAMFFVSATPKPSTPATPAQAAPRVEEDLLDLLE